VDVNLFFPGTGGAGAAAEARKVCASCPVTARCLEHAMSVPELFGVWAGTTERERQAMRRLARRRAA
jgi:WhiB family redox-sensing transcriptional regulator